MRTNILPILLTIICQESSMVPGHIIGVQNKSKRMNKTFKSLFNVEFFKQFIEKGKAEI